MWEQGWEVWLERGQRDLLELPPRLWFCCVILKASLPLCSQGLGCFGEQLYLWVHLVPVCKTVTCNRQRSV